MQENLKQKIANVFYWRDKATDKSAFFTRDAYYEVVDILKELTERDDKLSEALKEFAPMSLLKINLEEKNPDFEYEIYTAGRKQGDTSEMDDKWEYVDFERVDYIEQTLYRRKITSPANRG